MLPLRVTSSCQPASPTATDESQQQRRQARLRTTPNYPHMDPKCYYRIEAASRTLLEVHWRFRYSGSFFDQQFSSGIAAGLSRLQKHRILQSHRAESGALLPLVSGSSSIKAIVYWPAIPLEVLLWYTELQTRQVFQPPWGSWPKFCPLGLGLQPRLLPSPAVSSFVLSLLRQRLAISWTTLCISNLRVLTWPLLGGTWGLSEGSWVVLVRALDAEQF